MTGAPFQDLVCSSKNRSALHQRFRSYLNSLWSEASAENDRNILTALPCGPVESLLDLGCDDGRRTRRYGDRTRAKRLLGVEIMAERAADAQRQGVHVVAADLNAGLPFATNSIEVICSNQVIEHLTDTDRFCSESHRVLMPNGTLVLSTENLASWHNIASLLFGWQPFSLANISTLRLGIGNPLALHRSERLTAQSWQHLRVFSVRGLQELLAVHGFQVDLMLGAGYFPAPAPFAQFDPRHAVYLTVRARRLR